MFQNSVIKSIAQWHNILRNYAAQENHTSKCYFCAEMKLFWSSSLKEKAAMHAFLYCWVLKNGNRSLTKNPGVIHCSNPCLTCSTHWCIDIKVISRWASEFDQKGYTFLLNQQEGLLENSLENVKIWKIWVFNHILSFFKLVCRLLDYSVSMQFHPKKGYWILFWYSKTANKARCRSWTTCLFAQINHVGICWNTCLSQ